LSDGPAAAAEDVPVAEDAAVDEVPEPPPEQAVSRMESARAAEVKAISLFFIISLLNYSSFKIFVKIPKIFKKIIEKAPQVLPAASLP
jgi:hypothetical protein